MVAEDVLETLGSDQRTRQEDVDQLIYDVLIEPTERVDLPITITERNAHELQQMRLFSQECPEVNLCKRMAKLWYRWVETKGTEYPCGVQGTWTRIRELVSIMPRIEEANTDYIAILLAPSPPPLPGTVLALRPLVMVATISSEGSHSVTGSLCEENQE